MCHFRNNGMPKAFAFAFLGPLLFISALAVERFGTHLRESGALNPKGEIAEAGPQNVPNAEIVRISPSEATELLLSVDSPTHTVLAERLTGGAPEWQGHIVTVLAEACTYEAEQDRQQQLVRICKGISTNRASVLVDKVCDALAKYAKLAKGALDEAMEGVQSDRGKEAQSQIDEASAKLVEFNAKLANAARSACTEIERYRQLAGIRLGALFCKMLEEDLSRGLLEKFGKTVHRNLFPDCEKANMEAENSVREQESKVDEWRVLLAFREWIETIARLSTEMSKAHEDKGDFRKWWTLEMGTKLSTTNHSGGVTNNLGSVIGVFKKKLATLSQFAKGKELSAIQKMRTQFEDRTNLAELKLQIEQSDETEIKLLQYDGLGTTGFRLAVAVYEKQYFCAENLVGDYEEPVWTSNRQMHGAMPDQHLRSVLPVGTTALLPEEIGDKFAEIAPKYRRMRTKRDCRAFVVEFVEAILQNGHGLEWPPEELKGKRGLARALSDWLNL